jgi:hypothetical protein
MPKTHTDTALILALAAGAPKSPPRRSKRKCSVDADVKNYYYY